MRTTKCLPLLACLLIVASGNAAVAEDAFYNIPLASLKLTEGTLPVAAGWSARRWQFEPAMEPYAVLDGPGEVFVGGGPSPRPWLPDENEPSTSALSIRAPKGTDISGRLFVPQTNFSGMVPLKFKVTPAEAKPEAKESFFKAKEEYYRRLQNRNIPGGAWFRHQADEAAKNLGGTNVARGAMPGMAAMRGGRPSELEDTYGLISGNRALSENLQLDRVLPATTVAEETVEVTNLTGITIKEMDWKGLIQNARPELDPLAAFIPAEQHAIFFPTFQSMVQMIDEADANGTPVLQLLEPRSEDADSRERYQKQLCLGLSEISRLLGPQVVASVAFTGSDPFLRVGTDVAVLFEARNPEVLKGYLIARQKAAQLANADAKPVEGEIRGVRFTGLVSPDRSISSYMASVSNVVFVSNSRVQLETLVNVARGSSPALSSQDEYVFFRSRYPRNDKSETAFVVLTDATIRRWCGPRWRIADSRRTRAAAVLAELQAAHLDELASGKAAGAALATDLKLPDAGELRLTRAGVTSAVYGSLNFMTPIVELPLTRVSRAEADAYQRWRDNYQRNWRQVFDPIAIRFAVSSNRLGAELTVTPLILSSDYREMISFSSGAQIAAGAGDPHNNTVLHVIFALNPQSPSVERAGAFAIRLAPGLSANPFGWLGQSIALYADEDPFWNQLQQSTNTDDFLEQNYPDLPVALRVEVKNPLGLAAFLTAVHAFVDQSAPRLTTWQNLEYQNQAYVKITARRSGADEMAKELAVYYASNDRSLTVTLSEPLLKRALDRQAASTNNSGKALPVRDWPGKNLSAVASRQFVNVLQALTRDTYQTRLQLLAWNNLPILNEWKRLYPAKDPVKVHEQLWGTKLLCPGGGTYVWNEKWQTMESTVFGHPGEPKSTSSPMLLRILGAEFGITFEHQGLSARAILDREAGRVRNP